MTPLMIGIIVAASVVAVFFVVMAAVVPFMQHDINMQIRDRSIKGNSTTEDFALKFNIMCDYQPGEVWRVEVFKDGELIGYANTPAEEEFDKNEERTVVVSAFTFTGTNSSDEDGGRVKFIEGEQYVLRVYYRELNSDATDIYTELGFGYARA